jgi:hypothetical protein
MITTDWRLSPRECAAKALAALQNREEGNQSVLDDQILEEIRQALESRRISQLALAREMHISIESFQKRMARIGLPIGQLRRGPLLLCDPDDLQDRITIFRERTHLTP